MASFPVGVLLDSFKTNIEDALKKAKKVGAEGIQVYAIRGELSPSELTAAKRKDFLNLVKSHGLKISALCGDFGLGFADRDKNRELIDASKRILDLAKELETNVVTTHIGVIPSDSRSERYQIMQEACFSLAEYADSMNAHFAVETGPEIAETLKGFLDGLHSTGVAVNLDPANFVMVTGDDPVKAVYTLKEYIVHTHAKDGKRLRAYDPEYLYANIEEIIKQGDAFAELPLGEGDVVWDNYLKALSDISYQGFLTIEREVGENPEADIEKAVHFLKNKMY